MQYTARWRPESTRRALLRLRSSSAVRARGPLRGCAWWPAGGGKGGGRRPAEAQGQPGAACAQGAGAAAQRPRRRGPQGGRQCSTSDTPTAAVPSSPTPRSGGAPGLRGAAAGGAHRQPGAQPAGGGVEGGRPAGRAHRRVRGRLRRAAEEHRPAARPVCCARRVRAPELTPVLVVQRPRLAAPGARRCCERTSLAAQGI